MKTRNTKGESLQRFVGTQSSELGSRTEAAKIKQEAPNDPSIKK
jgi:hypothetical protein